MHEVPCCYQEKRNCCELNEETKLNSYYDLVTRRQNLTVTRFRQRVMRPEANKESINFRPFQLHNVNRISPFDEAPHS